MADTQREEIAKLEALYAAHPEGRVFTHLADAYRRAGELSRAREILNDGLRRHPDYSSAHVVLGKVLTDQGEPDAALGAFRRVLELDRHNLVALRALGDLLMQRGDAASAIGYYRDLQGLDPSDEQLRQTLARIEADAAAAPSPTYGAGVTADPVPEPETAADYTDRSVDDSSPVETGAGVETTGAGWLHAADSGEDDSGAQAEGDLLAGFETFGVGESPPDDGDDWFAGASLDAGSSPTETSEDAEEGVDTEGFEVLAGFGWQQDADSTEGGEAGEDDPDLAAWSFDVETGAGAEAQGEIGEAEAEGAMLDAVGGEPTEPTWTEPPIEEWSGVVVEEDTVEWPEPAAFDVAPTPDEAWSRVTAFEAGETEAFTFEANEAAAEDESIGTHTGDVEQVGPDDVEEEPATAESLGEIEAGAIAGSATNEIESGASADGEEDAAFQVSRYAAAFLQPAEQPDAGMVTATMADLYARQGFYERAIQVYRQLLEEVPDDEKLKERLDEVAALQETARNADANQLVDDHEEGPESTDAAWLSGQSGVAGAEATPYAWAESVTADAAGEPTAGDYFTRLLSWRPAGGSRATIEPELLELDAELDWEPDGDALLEPGGAEESQAGEVELEAGAVAAAFEEWFGAEGDPEAGGTDGGSRGPEPEGDADLEMFRSWLQSLKK
jgi:tetratricopeptide (TPR) repeat protein